MKIVVHHGVIQFTLHATSYDWQFIRGSNFQRLRLASGSLTVDRCFWRHPRESQKGRQGEMSMRSRILCYFGAGIFIVTAVYAHAAQGKPAASTVDELTS